MGMVVFTLLMGVIGFRRLILIGGMKTLSVSLAQTSQPCHKWAAILLLRVGVTATGSIQSLLMVLYKCGVIKASRQEKLYLLGVFSLL
jgi:hypothetical protein